MEFPLRTFIPSPVYLLLKSMVPLLKDEAMPEVWQRKMWPWPGKEINVMMEEEHYLFLYNLGPLWAQVSVERDTVVESALAGAFQRVVPGTRFVTWEWGVATRL